MSQGELFTGLIEQIPEGDSKVCSKCKKRKLITSFGTVNGGLSRPECRSCMSEMVQIRNKLRLTETFPSSDYTCPICEQGTEEVKNYGGKNNTAWVLDHCHKTENFRGWLCHRCNRGLGAFSDDIGTLEKAIHYLEENK